ncbi:YfiR family protein [Candidatus Auribacterota bacterium]
MLVRYQKILFFILLFVLTFSSSAFSVDENTVKAIFLARLTRFVDWPKESKVNDLAKPFVIGVIGKNPFGNALKVICKKKKIKDKSAIVKYLKDLSEIEGCDLLFISRFIKIELSDILKVTQGNNILTFSDTKGFAKKGVHVNFFNPPGKEKRIKFEINVMSSRESGFTISHLLLKEARIVENIEGFLD